MRSGFLFVGFALLVAACTPSPKPKPQAAGAVAGAAPEHIPGVTTLEPGPAAPAPAPVAAPAPAPAPAPVAAQPAAEAVPLAAEWGQILSESIDNDTLTTKVASPWGPIDVTGPATGPGGAVTRYWQAWARVEFPAIFALSTGVMRERLGEMDHEAGHKEYRQSIAERYATNAPTWFKVEAVSEQGPGRAAASVRNGTRSGEEQVRDCYLVETAEGWRFERIQLQR